MTLPVIVIGSGGHAAVVADALLAAGAPVLGFTDADPARHGKLLCGLPVLGTDEVLAAHAPAAVALANGIGGAGRPGTQGLRRTVQQRLEKKGFRFVTVRHPSAVVSQFARVATSAQLLATSVVQANADVGAGCIVNTGAIVEHDARLGDYVHVACGAVLCGHVHIGGGSHVGAGSTVKEGVALGADTVVGAGAVVLKSFPGGSILLGVPARDRRTEQ